jgi:hypothetical protein
MSDDKTSIGLSEEDKSMLKMISETFKPLFTATVPDIFYKLIKNGKLDMSKINDPIYLMSMVQSNLPIESEFKIHVSIHDEFIDCAKMALDRDKKMVALSLICTVIEHHLNFYYRKALELQGFSDVDTSKILRSNFNAKLTWLAHLVFRREIPPEEIKYINEITDLRNEIIHFKAKPISQSWDDGSAGEISKKIEKLDLPVLFQYPEKLQYNLEQMLEDEYPDYKKAKELTQSILDGFSEEQIQELIERDLLSKFRN